MILRIYLAFDLNLFDQGLHNVGVIDNTMHLTHHSAIIIHGHHNHRTEFYFPGSICSSASQHQPPTPSHYRPVQFCLRNLQPIMRRDATFRINQRLLFLPQLVRTAAVGLKILCIMVLNLKKKKKVFFEGAPPINGYRIWF